MIDHMSLHVTDFEKSIDFYKKALAPLGYSVLVNLPVSVTKTTDVAGLGVAPKSDFWIIRSQTPNPPLHIAFRANSNAQVDEFYKAALEAGGTDNGAPGPRPHYHEGYYGGFVLDPEGNNIEAVFHNDATR
jgi:catechol 2,3-dioxygenase-like lactoylglutathione lyase family enzyme